MHILVVDDEPKVLADIVAKIKAGWESEEETEPLEIEQAGNAEEVRQLIERHREDKDWVLHHVFSDLMVEPGGWSFGCQEVYRLVREKGLNGTSPGMTIVSNNPITMKEIAKELHAGCIYKPMIEDSPSLLIDALHPPRGGTPEAPTTY